MEMGGVSPLFHETPLAVFFHRRVGTNPFFSEPKEIPSFSPSLNFLAYSAILSTPNLNLLDKSMSHMNNVGPPKD